VVIWTDTAINDLTDFIENARKDTEKSAKKYIEKLINYVDSLEIMSELGTKITNTQINYSLRQLIYKSHKIIYYLRNDNVYILTVLHSKQDFQNALMKVLNEN